jgi:NADH dehydrogenase [ubiquinone] 1 alpha subcomplex assembly factor 2
LDVVRLRNLKVLAAEADKRWAAKKSLLDAPVKADRLPLNGFGISDAGRLRGDSERGTWNPETNTHEAEKAPEDTGSSRVVVDRIQAQDRVARFNELQDDRRKEQKQTEDPWKQARGGPSEEWQPQAAQLAPAKR